MLKDYHKFFLPNSFFIKKFRSEDKFKHLWFFFNIYIITTYIYFTEKENIKTIWIYDFDKELKGYMIYHFVLLLKTFNFSSQRLKNGKKNKNVILNNDFMNSN